MVRPRLERPFYFVLPILLGLARDRWRRGVLDLEPMRRTTRAIGRTEELAYHVKKAFSPVKLTRPSTESFKILKPGRRDSQGNQRMVILRDLTLCTTFVLTCITFLIVLGVLNVSRRRCGKIDIQ